MAFHRGALHQFFKERQSLGRRPSGSELNEFTSTNCCHERA
jgi:hypothetical protein